MVYENKMMNSGNESEQYQTKTLRCVEQDCQEMFDWTPEDQVWFHKHGLKYPPARCVNCRRNRRLAKMKEGKN